VGMGSEAGRGDRFIVPVSVQGGVGRGHRHLDLIGMVNFLKKMGR
jgi:hypothetical protein